MKSPSIEVLRDMVGWPISIVQNARSQKKAGAYQGTFSGIVQVVEHEEQVWVMPTSHGRPERFTIKELVLNKSSIHAHAERSRKTIPPSVLAVLNGEEEKPVPPTKVVPIPAPAAAPKPEVRQAQALEPTPTPAATPAPEAPALTLEQLAPKLAQAKATVNRTAEALRFEQEVLTSLKADWERKLSAAHGEMNRAAFAHEQAMRAMHEIKRSMERLISEITDIGQESEA